MSDPYASLNSLYATFGQVAKAVDEASQGRTEYERERAMFSVVSAYSLAEEMWIFKADPARPVFSDWMANGRKTAGDSPYTIYLTAPIHPENTYRLYGKLGQPTYFGIQIYKRVQGFNAPSRNTNLDAIQVNADGSFEIICSRERPEKAANWLPLADQDFLVMTREYRVDPRVQEPMQVQIECLVSDGTPPPSLAERVEKAASYFKSIVFSTMEILDLLRRGVNQFAPPDSEIRAPQYGDSLFPTQDTYYDGFVVSLKPGEALKLTGRLPEKWVYTSFVFYDLWYATLNYPEERCFLTGEDLILNPDGTYTIFVSAEDPERPNWIQMGKLHEGLFSYRWMVADSNPKPDVEVVRIADPR